MIVRLLAALLLVAGACSPAWACKVEPWPSTAELVEDAVGIHIVRVLRLEALPDPTSQQVQDSDAIAVVETIEVVKGGPLASDRLLARPDDCGAFLWPGMVFLVYTNEPSAKSPLLKPGFGSFALDASGESAQLSEIMAILTGNTNQ
jgi:hypothetical protein